MSWMTLVVCDLIYQFGAIFQRFQYILNASTSPATRMSEETLTYLNQGGPYFKTLSWIFWKFLMNIL